MQPPTTVGSITLNPAGVYRPFPLKQPPTDVIRSAPGPLPARYTHLDPTLTGCHNSLAHLAVELTGHGGPSAAVVGLDISYLDEAGARHIR